MTRMMHGFVAASLALFLLLMQDVGSPLPRDRKATNVEDFIYKNAKEIIQAAAGTTVKFGHHEVDTAHYADKRSDMQATAGYPPCHSSERRS